MENEDHGKDPYVVDIEKLTLGNDRFRVAKWTGSKLQMTVMAIPVGGEVGLERHDDIDQFLRIEAGKARVVMGPEKDKLEQSWDAEDDFAIFVPAGTWHNILNSGEEPLKMYSIYASPEHERGTIHNTYEEAMKAEAEHHH